jgi:signal transduction histidine kinase
MKQMTLHLLDLERLENGNILDITACDLVEIGQSLVQQMSGLAQKQNIHLTASLPDTPVMVEGDFVYLSRAVANLMSNALKFTPAGGTVTVSLKQKDQAAIISVQDTGPGIPPNHQARIFNRFYRVKDQKETREKIGSGLGLSIVKSIVTQHQGTIWLESKEGVGTTFHISLPVLKP